MMSGPARRDWPRPSSFVACSLSDLERIMAQSRYVVGIDLGTTNSALAYVDTGVANAEDTRPAVMPIPQLVQPAQVEPRTLLPSFLYLPNPGELPAGSLKLAWDAAREHAVGEFAR